jgi:hypothetical protein
LANEQPACGWHRKLDERPRVARATAAPSLELSFGQEIGLAVEQAVAPIIE